MDGRPRLDPEENTAPPFGTWPLDVALANSVLAGGEYGVRVVRQDGLTRLVGQRAGTGVSLGNPPTWRQLYRMLIRLRLTRRRRDPAWLALLTEVLDPPRADPERGGSVPEDAGAEWLRFAGMLAEHPAPRMHCATAEPRRPDGAAGRLGEPAPAHPAFPGGTIAVRLPALLRTDPALGHTLLREVITNRFERRENAARYFLEHFVRPPLRAFRLALESPRGMLLSPSADTLAVELSPETQATGRFVVTPGTAVREVERVTPGEVHEGVRELVHTLRKLSETFEREEFGEHERTRRGEFRAAMRRVMAAELRDLETGSADVLAGDHPLRGFVHTVPAEQDELLRRVLRTVQERTRLRRWNRDLGQPVVVIDVASCGLLPERVPAPEQSGPEPYRSRQGLDAVARTVGRDEQPHRCRAESGGPQEHAGTSGRIPREREPHRPPETVWDPPTAELAELDNRATAATGSGLPRFVWDVRDAGGRVVFCALGSERDYEHARALLDRAGVPEAELIRVPGNGTGTAVEWTVCRLRELGDVDVVAVFETAATAPRSGELAGVLTVAVSAHGDLPRQRNGNRNTAAGPRTSSEGKDPVISSFETSPWRRSARAQPVLSNTHSLEELQIASLRENRSAWRWAVRLTRAETASMVEAVLDDADRAAERTARGAVAKFAADEPVADPAERSRRTVGALHHVFTRKQFLKGSRSNYLVADMHRDADHFVTRGEPVEVMLLGFPVKQSLNRLKACGPLPDIAELGGLIRLRELQRAARGVHPPGLRFNILTDGRHFRPRPASVTAAYTRKLHEYASMVGLDGCVSIREIDSLATERFGREVTDRRPAMYERFRRSLEQALRGLDITDHPLRTLERVRDRADAQLGPDSEITARSLYLFREMVMSMVYSVPVPTPAGTDRLGWARRVYADVYNLDDARLSSRLRQARVAVLRRAWHNAVRYLSTMRVDEELGYEKLFDPRVRLTVSAVTKGRCGFTYLGGSGLLPWQGTGVLDSRGYVAVDFAVSLIDQGFVPAFSPLLGPRQPLMMVPPQYARLPSRGTRAPGTRLDEALREKARLRRK
ncbi:L-tyrosine/L-tryptophan isonitrile synthase family protein [Actinopolyspora erythraea]|uniref:L-tyrosine/L-tryptophan isonitrile synthase family protein n=1 Tax=Actinopolyspora erythraea TaxID=414996 RepID=UPI0006941124|nr:L-tyrosine/L-tryptophan isonitrile synthase family protein [Actinopolyspora erythraea]